MCRLWPRQALWALALLCVLAPSHADGSVGCLFSSTLCVEGAEWCYDDFAFGRCIPIYEEQVEEGSLYQYDMGPGQLKWFETELEKLAARGYRWEHAYTQCVLQAMLYTLRQDLDPAQVNPKICDHFIDPKLGSEPPEITIPDQNDDGVEPGESAYIRFTPNSRMNSDFANEIFNPPENDPAELYVPNIPIVIEDDSQLDETPSDNIRELIMMGEGDSPVVPFEGFRERMQYEKDNAKDENAIPFYEKTKKSLPEEILTQGDDNAELVDQERLTAHFRKYKTKPPPYSAEYLTSNRYSDLEEKVRANAIAKYKQSIASNFPHLYENTGEIPEPRIYFDEDAIEEFPVEAGSGDPYDSQDKDKNDPKHTKNMEYLVNYWREIIDSKLKPNGGAMYAEGGPVTADGQLGGEKSKFQPEGYQELVNTEWGFKRRERDDVKKPGPRLDAKSIKLYHQNKSVTGDETDLKRNQNPVIDDADPTYTHVLFENQFDPGWNNGVLLMKGLEEMLDLDRNTFTNLRVRPGEIAFKVNPNSKGYNAIDVAKHIGDIKDKIRTETGAPVVSAGTGVTTRRPIIRRAGPSQLPWWPTLIVIFTALAFGIFVLGLCYYACFHESKTKELIAELGPETTRDYQELCRARMVNWSGISPYPLSQPTDPIERLASLTREAEGNSPSARSSTSSWSEEPALTNMDISTGHMVLAYMEDHLRNKDRLEQEWRALCAYEAEPCATVAALKPENNGKNRYLDVLPYDHSRVTLNPLSNHVASDYINASTITDHDPRNPAYIAAAGPLPHTAPDFWQMVWEQGSVVMVMLTRLTANGQQLCHRYWPEEGSELYHIYEVHLVSEHIWCDDYLVRSFYLKNQRTGETRTVTQFHFLTWPENGVPLSTKALLEFRRKVNKSYRGRSCPIVVHCSDGAGRTGTYCLIDMVLNRMAKGAKEIDIAATLEHIRDQRPRTVATRQQFEFVLMAVAEEVHAILKALPAHLQQMQEKKDKEKEKEKSKDKDTNKEKK